mmetsp:Transcript_18881/g.53027  ORF Transcript_18881/g.53027 Transcript_18881/m.53027 type:complete len:291 (+) Transcript_18881:71-943(+)
MTVDCPNIVTDVEDPSSQWLSVLSNVVGWSYVVVWSISFYPQLILNWQRQAVTGLSFSFLYLNLIGYVAYSIYNTVLFYSPIVKAEYCDQHPDSQRIPVHLNDVIFALHGLVLTLLQCGQCFIYDRGTQYIPWSGVAVGFPLWVFMYITALLGSIGVISYLRMINWISYVKLTVTFCKYVPQAYLNFERKSTVGWSIGNIILDFTGGVLSLTQGVLDWINYNDYHVFIGDPTKFGLAWISIGFDILFMVQHYVLYPQKSNPIEEVEDDYGSGFDEEEDDYFLKEKKGKVN